ncbi:Kinase-like protein [Mycena sanguinolenta]|uniref:Kinase-like protein n=1 Tax=Mycena sanguinolenta TaxID=230812 RepID=A0A8H6XA31_9AGAR|nr:Kinase-like protein [Mycena sanguinolenta]
MDLHADSDPEVIIVSTSDPESTPYALFVFCWLNLMPLKTPGGCLSPPQQTRKGCQIFEATYTRQCSEIKPGRQAAEHLVNNYNYFITGEGEAVLVERVTRAVTEVPGMVLPYISASSSLEKHQKIRLGDVNLIKEFKEMRSSPQSSVVGRQTPGASIRKVYTAKLEGHESGHMTVAMYEGDGAEEAWNQHLEKYEAVRHPNIMQLYGLVDSRRLRGLVFHGGVHSQFSVFEFAYIIGYCCTEFGEATNYIGNVIGHLMKTSVWIRPSTGQLCLDLAQGEPEMSFNLLTWDAHVLRLENVPLNAPDSEGMIISSLSEDQYYELCSQPSIAWHHIFQVSTEHPVGPGIFRPDSQYATCVRITQPLQILPTEELHWDHHGGAAGELLPNSWIRYDSTQTSSLQLKLWVLFPLRELQKSWVAQANHIFTELEEVAHVKDYVGIDEVQFMLRIADKHHIPEGYLFICPPQNFCTSIELQVHLYRWPACPAYWSLDPSGADHLSTEDARILGFPAIHIETVVGGLSWDHSIYEGLRRFHQGKGFNPYGREVARRLGYPLYEVLRDLGSEVPFPAHKVQRYPCECHGEDPVLCQELGHYL